MAEQSSDPQQDKLNGRRNTRRRASRLSWDPKAMGERLDRWQEGRRAFRGREFLEPRSQD